MGTFTIIITRNGLYYFVLKNKMGEELLRSSGYISKMNCEADIAAVKLLSQYQERYEVKRTVSGQFFFNITNPEGYIIVKSEMFSSDDTCRERMLIVKSIAKLAKVDDLAAY